VDIQSESRHDAVLTQLEHSLAKQWQPSSHGWKIKLVHTWHLLPDPAPWLEMSINQAHSTRYPRLLRKANRLTNDPVTRMDSYTVAERWALKKGYIVPLASGSVGYLVKPSVQGVTVCPFGIMPASNSWTSVDVI